MFVHVQPVQPEKEEVEPQLPDIPLAVEAVGPPPAQQDLAAEGRAAHLAKLRAEVEALRMKEVEETG